MWRCTQHCWPSSPLQGLTELSIGMSDDYETAIRFGATHVRVGTAIFGARVQPQA